MKINDTFGIDSGRMECYFPPCSKPSKLAAAMKVTILNFAFLFISCRPDTTVEVQLSEQESGHYFIIWTSDKSKLSNDGSKPIKFDRNRVLYLNYHFRDSLGIKPLNEIGNDISKRLKSFMGNEFYMNFYNPTDQEYQEHPNWDRFYLEKQPRKERLDLEAKGYQFTDPLIKQELIKAGKYQPSG